jgi:hypothetical protein
MATPCQHCGFVNELDATFCGSCGAFLVLVVMPNSTGSDQAPKSSLSQREKASSHAVVFDRTEVAMLAGQIARVRVGLRNIGTLVEQYSMSIVGVPADWVSLETSVVRLHPGAEQRFTITVHPPEDAGSGDHHLTIVVSASAGETSSYQLSVHIGSDRGNSKHDADRNIEPDTARRQHLESTHDTGETTVVQVNDDRYVFVSYSRADQAYVDELCGWLRRRGVVLWIDSDIDYGTRWQTVVKDRLDAAVAVLVVMTPAAEESRWVAREVHRAEAHGKPIFPLLLDGTPFFGLSDLQHEDVSGGRPPTDRFIDRLRRCCQP